jgi:hypothetical protein
MIDKYCVPLLELWVVKNDHKMSVCWSLALSFAMWIPMILNKKSPRINGAFKT